MSDFLNRPVLYTKDLVQMLGVSAITIRRWWKSGKFPKPIKHSVLMWPTDAVQAWLDNSIRNSENNND